LRWFKFDCWKLCLEDLLRARLPLALFALSLTLVACLTTPKMDSNSISGLVSLNSSLTSGEVAAPSLDSRPSAIQGASVANVIPGRLIVKFKPGLRAQSFGPLSAKVAGRSVMLETQRALGVTGAQLMRASGVDAKGTLELAEQLSLRSDVEYAEPDRRIRALLTPNDPQFENQWAMGPSASGRLNMPDAWDVSTGSSLTGPNPVIAVIDSGVMLNHPDLASKILPGYDFVSDPNIAADNDPSTSAGSDRDANPDDPGDGELDRDDPSRNASYHGTHVSGIAAAIGNNRYGMAGVSWGAQILPARILGVGGGSISDMIDAVLWAAGIDSDTVPPAYPRNPYKADVINLSVGGGGSCSSAEQDAFNRVIASGTAVVVAAGNEDVDAWTTDPASCAGVIVVGAVGRDGTRATYSNYGERVTIMAPGGDKGTGGGILSTSKDAAGNPSYEYKIGTSMATPHVAGVIALMRSLRPKLTPGQLETLLDAEADTVNCTGRTGCGMGLLDAGATMRVVRASSSAPAPDFALLPSRSVLILPSASVTMSVTVRAAAFNGLTGPIALSVQSVGGIMAQLSTQNLIAGGNGSVTVTFNMAQAAAGAHVVRLVGSTAGVTRNVSFFIPISLVGTLVQACYLTVDGQCDEQKTQTARLDTNGSSTSAPYSINNLLPTGDYQMLAWKDLNDDGVINSGDLYGESPLRVSPPQQNVAVALERLNATTSKSVFRFVLNSKIR
jgi:serine protease